MMEPWSRIQLRGEKVAFAHLHNHLLVYVVAIPATFR